MYIYTPTKRIPPLKEDFDSMEIMKTDRLRNYYLFTMSATRKPRNRL